MVALLAPGSAAAAQAAPPGGRGGQAARRDTTPGFVIRDQAVIRSCVRCHVRDSTGRLERISYLRKTPEGWETSVRRMVMLHETELEPATARGIVRYLANEQGLSPEEARPGRFETERRLVDHRYTADSRTEQVCRACHSLGRVITQRRTRDEWELLVATHRGLYPDADFQAFRRGGPPPPDSAGAPHPMDQAIAHLARAFPLRTPEWAAWSATMRPPRVDGEWLLSGNEPGRGRFYGRVTITRSPAAPDEFTTRARYRYVKDGRVVTREGRALVYTGFQWRGRSTETGAPPDSLWREVLFIEPGWQSISGRWFKGAYDEFGMDVTMARAGANTVLTALSPRALRTGVANQRLTILGANLPRGLAADAVDLGPGVRVTGVEGGSDSDSVAIVVQVDSGAPVGERDVFVAGAALRGGAVVYDRVSRIKVTPLAGMARVGGARFPKQYAVFEAFAFHDGSDRKPDTADDLELGPVNVTWSLEEYGVTYDDDDLRFVGSIDARGIFTPNVDGPNPQRSGQRNNVGDVWAVATYLPEGRNARPLKARAHLLVTVPLYMRWEPWRVAP
jgi:quinohemoprotein amine dehydrogenase